MNESQINPLLKPFAVLPGHWEISSPQFPDLKGEETFEWIENGSYLLSRSSAPEPFPSATRIIGSDEAQGIISALYYDTRNVSRIYQMEFKNNFWKIWRNDPKFSQRFEGKVSDDKNTIAAKWEKSEDGKNWEHDFDLIYKRIR